MAWIEPLKLQTWFINVFSGSQEIFTAIALMVLVGGAAFLRMNALTLFFLIGLFFLMFSNYVGSVMFFLVIVFGSLVIGYWLSRIMK